MVNFFEKIGGMGEVQREFVARPDSYKDQILYKHPDHNVRKWTQLTVQADEAAVFFRDGQVQGVLGPGRHTLDSNEIPFLSRLVDMASAGNMFITEIYFVSMREIPDLPFGGIIDNVEDPETRLAIGLQIFGEYSLRVLDPAALIVNLAGTRQLKDNDDIVHWMREQILKVMRTDITSHIVRNNWKLLGIAAYSEDIEGEVLEKLPRYVQTYGVQVVRFGNFTIGMKDEDEAKLKKFRETASYSGLAASSPGYMQVEMGKMMEGAGEGMAKGGTGPSSALLFTGLGLGNMMNNQMVQPQAQQAPAQVRCPQCGTPNLAGAKFCSNCGGSMAPPKPVTTNCPKCGTANDAAARFCNNCGSSMAPPTPTTLVCPNCSKENSPGAKFCSGCGTPFHA